MSKASVNAKKSLHVGSPHCYLLTWLLVNCDFILAKRAGMEDVHTLVHAAAGEHAKQKAAQL